MSANNGAGSNIAIRAPKDGAMISVTRDAGACIVLVEVGTIQAESGINDPIDEVSLSESPGELLRERETDNREDEFEQWTSGVFAITLIGALDVDIGCPSSAVDTSGTGDSRRRRGAGEGDSDQCSGGRLRERRSIESWEEEGVSTAFPASDPRPGIFKIREVETVVEVRKQSEIYRSQLIKPLSATRFARCHVAPGNSALPVSFAKRGNFCVIALCVAFPLFPSCHHFSAPSKVETLRHLHNLMTVKSRKSVPYDASRPRQAPWLLAEPDLAMPTERVGFQSELALMQSLGFEYEHVRLTTTIYR